MINLKASETGKFIFAASEKVICIYKHDKENPIYKYERQEGDRDLDDTEPQFISDQLFVFTTGQFAIGIDLENEKELFREQSEGYHSTYIFKKPLVFKDKKVLLGE